MAQICQEGRGGEDLVRLISVEQRFSRKFNIHSELLRLEIINTDDPTTPDWLERLFTQILATVRENFNVQPNERVRIQLNHPDLDNPIYIAFRPYSELTLELILDEIAKVMQSKKTLVIDDQTSITVTYVASKEGGFSANKAILNEAFMSGKKRTFISPVANAGYQTCFGQSIVLGMNEISYHKKISPTAEETKHYKRVAATYAKRPLQIAMAMEMYQEFNVNPLVAAGRPEWCIFQEHLKAEYQILIYDGQAANCIIFRGDADPNVPVLRLYLMEKHFYYIKKINSLFNRSYYCSGCEKPYSNKNNHVCKALCRSCRQLVACPLDRPRIQCELCHRYFRGKKCLERHNQNVPLYTVSTCMKYRACLKCYTTIDTHEEDAINKHTCDVHKCRNCMQLCKPNHRCYMKRLSEEVEGETIKYFVFYDFETILDEDNIHCLETFT
ncbi:uncharacterized protein LOC126824339 [Patella vulgata]|uniref:uncharacterized protein LOC126824339 n=1 Tax=Patella vulgata TaxID=6465 RepID=UPI0024A97C31|nr:uncharacterized protein LOC126824339 [Patella vulgata]